MRRFIVAPPFGSSTPGALSVNPKFEVKEIYTAACNTGSAGKKELCSWSGTIGSNRPSLRPRSPRWRVSKSRFGAALFRFHAESS